VVIGLVLTIQLLLIFQDIQLMLLTTLKSTQQEQHIMVENQQQQQNINFIQQHLILGRSKQM
jgi:hypothetical protein